MQWREYELRRLQQEGLNINEQAAPTLVQDPPQTPHQAPSDAEQHVCTAQQEEPEETEQDKAHKVSPYTSMCFVYVDTVLAADACNAQQEI